MNVDSSWISSKLPLLLQAGSWHSSGVRRNCAVWSIYCIVSQRLHLKAARVIIGCTGVARMIMPSTMAKLPMCAEPRIRKGTIVCKPLKRTVTFSVSAAYSGASICSCAWAAWLACLRYSSGCSMRFCAKSLSAMLRSGKSTVNEVWFWIAIWAMRLRYLSAFKKSWNRCCGSKLTDSSVMFFILPFLLLCLFSIRLWNRVSFDIVCVLLPPYLFGFD